MSMTDDWWSYEDWVDGRITFNGEPVTTDEVEVLLDREEYERGE